MEAYQDFLLLVDGKEAFPSILSAIDHAKKNIHINMFIWRDDNIGNEIGKACLEAANRGVKVFISIDRYGVVLEKSEESKKSFFHKKQSIIEKIKIQALKIFYPMKGSSKDCKDVLSELYKKIMNHPNIVVSNDIFKADHSKYYIIDDEILFLGGINIVDKENGADMQGRSYQDYMVKISGSSYVSAFKTKIEKGIDIADDYSFGINSKEISPRLFEMENIYLNMINNCNSNLEITMAYFSPLKKFTKAIINAYKRGVKITILIPTWANYQNDTNRKTIKKLMKKTNDGIKVYFSPKMVHTKLMIADDLISFGSTNITKKAFKQLNELNLCLIKKNCPFIYHLLDSIISNYQLSKEIKTYKEIKYNPIMAFIEGFLV